MGDKLGVWLRNLVRDVLWAKAHVLVTGGWKTRPAWRYLRWCRKTSGLAIPPEVLKLARGHYLNRK